MLSGFYRFFSTFLLCGYFSSAIAAPTTKITVSSDDVISAPANSVTIADIKSRLAKNGLMAIESTTDSTNTIDLLLWYTNREMEILGAETLFANAESYVETANQGLEDSGINAQFVIVGFRKTVSTPDYLPIVSDGSATSIMGAWNTAVLNDSVCSFSSGGVRDCTTTTDSPENAIWTGTGADENVLIAPFNTTSSKTTTTSGASGSKLGEAGENSEVAAIYDYHAETPFSDSSVDMGLTFTHELGHTMGANHELADDTEDAWGEAHAYNCDNKVTVMNSIGYTSSKQWDFFSDPSHQEGSDYCGVADSADNTDVVSGNVAAVAARQDMPDSAGTVSFDSDSYDVSDTDGTATITLTRDGDTTDSAYVQLALTGSTATDGKDYRGGVYDVTFAAGSSTATVSVPLIASASDNSTDSATMTLRYPVGLTVGDTSTATLNITKTIDGDAGTVTASVPSTVQEGNSLTVTLTRTGGSAGTLLYRVLTDAETASSLAGNFTYTDQLVTFADGETSKTVTIPTADDSEDTGSLTFNVFVLPLADKSEIESHEVTLIDAEDAGTFTMSAASTVSQGGTLTVTINRTDSTSGSVALTFSTADGSGVAGTDYTAEDETITFADGESSKTVTVPVLSSGSTSSKTFTINLATSTSGATISTASQTETISAASSSSSSSGGGGGSMGFVSVALILIGILRKYLWCR